MKLLAILCVLLAAPTTYRFAKEGAVVRVVEEQLLGGDAYTLEVWPDGTVRERGEALPTRMTPAQVQTLLRFIIEEQKLTRFDEAAVAREAKRFPGCGNGATATKIELFVTGHRKTVRVAQLRGLATLVPVVRPALAVDERLRLEARLARHGGRKKVAALLAVVNKHPEMKKHKPLTLAAFQMVNAAGAHFRRDTFTPPPTVLIAVVKDGKAKITLLK